MNIAKHILPFFIATSLVLTGCNEIKTKVILDTNVNEYTSFVIKDNYVVLNDTNINLAEGVPGDTNNQVDIQAYEFINSDFVENDMEDTRSFFKSLTKDDVLINLNGYDYSPDSLPKEIYLQFKDSITDYNRTRRFKNFTAFISNSNVLHVYNSQNQKHLALMQEFISIPLIQELFFYDFDKDSIPELFIFFHFYKMNHKLVDIKCYKLFGMD